MTTLDLELRDSIPEPRVARRDIPRVVRKFRPDIEGLRAIAVTLVVLSHLGLGFSGGYVGVDVFFVISGFLITRQLVNEFDRRDKISFLGFYARRAKRILPAAAVVIVGTVLALWKWDSPLRLRQDVLDGVFSAVSGINWRLAAHGTNYFELGTQQSAFQHYWSLAVEEQFYFLWPALILLVGYLAGRRWGRRKSLIWTLLVISAVSLGLSVTTTTSSPSWAYFGTQTRAWELALGALIAVTVTVWTRMPPALSCQMSWAGLIMIAVAGLVDDSSTVYPGRAVILPVIGSALVITGGCPGWARSGELVLRRMPFQFFGRLSYSWYLTHWPFFIILPLALGHSLSLGDKWLVLFGSLALAIVMHYAIEGPLRSWRGFTTHRGLALGMGGSFAGIAVLVSLLVAGQGLSGGGSAPVLALPGNGSVAQVEQAVAAGARTRQLPARLSPSLAAAGDDKPPATQDCLVPETQSEPAAEGRCTFGDLTATRSMVLLGDSHANMWMPAFEAFAKTNHWKLVEYAKAACSPGVYPTYVDPITNRLYTECNAWRQAIFEEIRQTHPAYVILASEIRTVEIDPSGMLQTVQTLHAAGAKVVYLEDTPNPQKVGSVPDCLAKNSGNIQKCSMQRSAPPTRLEGMIQRTNENRAVARAGVDLIDPTNWFCTASTCPPVINNIVVYADNSHLTATYANWLSPILSSQLSKVVR